MQCFIVNIFHHLTPAPSPLCLLDGDEAESQMVGDQADRQHEHGEGGHGGDGDHAEVWIY